LVELLVVIGIIALLISILMPALTNARRQAVRVRCAAHLAQIGQAMAMYTGENKGGIPMAYRYPVPGWPRGYHWCDHLAPYLQKEVGQDETAAVRDRSVLWGCPAWDSRRVDPMPNEYWGRSWKIGYGYNAFPLEPMRPYDARSTMVITEGAGAGRYFKLCEISHQSERGLVTDATEIYVGIGYPWDPSVPVERQQQYSFVSPTRHGPWGSAAGVNVLYFDGHVSAVSAREVYYAFGDPIRSDPP
jgi:prepilin-type processing-associated H-X9-DG protein